MFETVEELDPVRHGGLSLKPIRRYDFAHRLASAPLGLSEVFKAARELPVVFPTRGRLLPVAQMAVRKDENLLVDPDGQWRISFVPAHIRRYPFILGGPDDARTFAVMVDTAALSKDGEGERLFVNNEIPKDGIVEHARAFLIDFEKELRRTERFFAPLEEHELLREKVYTIRQGEEQTGRVTGFRIVEKTRLLELDDKTLGSWAKSGLLEVIYAHLHSLENWTKLTKRSVVEKEPES